MAFVGAYMHRRGFVTPSGKKMMALLSQQVTIPAFLFAKIIHCPDNGGGVNPDESSTVCPSVADRISDLKLLLVWPAYVVFCGLLTGYLAARLSNTPKIMTRSCLAACAFGNSTGLVITLLTVVHHQFRNSGAELGRIDPTTFLSVYLLLYPVLQWGVGGWLLAPEEKKDDDDDIDVTQKFCNVGKMENGNAEGSNDIEGLISEMHILSPAQYATEALRTPNRNHHKRSQSVTIGHILNSEPERKYSPALAAGEEEFGGLISPLKRIVVTRDKREQFGKNASSEALKMMVKELSFTSFDHFQQHDSFSCDEGVLSDSNSPPHMGNGADDGPLTMEAEISSTSLSSLRRDSLPIEEDTPLLMPSVSTEEIKAVQQSDIMPLTTTLLRISQKVFQPPVIGSIAGLFIASFPWIRGLLVNIWGVNGKVAPLQWMFDGITSVGNAAVPINMTILGINLSSTFKKKSKEENEKDKAKLLPNRTMLAVVFGKMVVMPILGILSTWFLQRYYVDFPDAIDATCYLVMMIVFITPTANNVMVMVELSGSSSKEGMARVIGYQYVVAPVILSVVLAVVVSLASCHFEKSPVCSV